MSYDTLDPKTTSYRFLVVKWLIELVMLIIVVLFIAANSHQNWYGPSRLCGPLRI
jgi:hypothetical protein